MREFDAYVRSRHPYLQIEGFEVPVTIVISMLDVNETGETAALPRDL